jgi:hypothetical protein
MEKDLICRWLDLPAGSWPPDHYTLLGFERGAQDLARAEVLVQERMQRVRPFQLTHPELATEAMNRLAQAWLCLTNVEERAVYDVQLFQDADRVETPQPESLAAEPDIPPAESPVPSPTEQVQSRPEPTARPLLPAPALPLPRNRRAFLHAVAEVRRAAMAWDAVGPYLMAPESLENRPAEIREFTRRMQALAALVRGDGLPLGLSGKVGEQVMTLARQQSIFPVLRTFSPEQKSSLALDWKAGRDWLRSWRGSLHEAIPQIQGRASLPRVWRRLGRFYLDHAATFLFLAGWLALDLSSPRLRGHWREQLVLLAIFAGLRTLWWLLSFRARTAKPTA